MRSVKRSVSQKRTRRTRTRTKRSRTRKAKSSRKKKTRTTKSKRRSRKRSKSSQKKMVQRGGVTLSSFATTEIKLLLMQKNIVNNFIVQIEDNNMTYLNYLKSQNNVERIQIYYKNKPDGSYICSLKKIGKAEAGPDIFSSMDDLIEYYKSNNLPDTDQRLHNELIDTPQKEISETEF